MNLTLVCTENITNKKKMKEEKKFPEDKERGKKIPKKVILCRKDMVCVDKRGSNFRLMTMVRSLERVET